MPDPNARLIKAIEDFTRELKVNNGLVRDNNNHLKAIERKLKPRITVTNYPYLAESGPTDETRKDTDTTAEPID